MAGVRSLVERMPAVAAPLVAALGGVTLEALAAFKLNGASSAAGPAPPRLTPPLYSALRELTRVAAGALAALGVGHPALDEVAAAFGPLGLATKLTGAGGGGCALTLLPPEEGDGEAEDGGTAVASAAAFRREAVARLTARGFDVFETRLGGAGVMLLP